MEDSYHVKNLGYVHGQNTVYLDAVVMGHIKVFANTYSAFCKRRLDDVRLVEIYCRRYMTSESNPPAVGMG